MSRNCQMSFYLTSRSSFELRTTLNLLQPTPKYLRLG